MNDGLKQRIIGAMVLVALAVIFLPVIFDKERIAPVDRATQIPLSPDIVPEQLPEPAKAPRPKDPILEEPFDDGTFDATESRIEDLEPKPAPSNSSEGVPLSWVLQIASYKSYEQALQTRDQLISEGYTSFVKKVQTDKGEHTRLFVGPSVDKNSMIKAKAEIDKAYVVDSILSKFKP